MNKITIFPSLTNAPHVIDTALFRTDGEIELVVNPVNREGKKIVALALSYYTKLAFCICFHLKSSYNREVVRT